MSVQKNICNGSKKAFQILNKLWNTTKKTVITRQPYLAVECLKPDLSSSA